MLPFLLIIDIFCFFLVCLYCSDRKLAVMVWIYGGAYILGTAAMYPGQLLALNGDVIVVGVNYRVSTLGWLSTGKR